MNGIKLIGGVNNCFWNVNGKCTNPQVTRNEVPACFSMKGRDWESTQNCTVTILGIFCCSGYKPQTVMNN